MACSRKVNPKLILRPGDLRHRITFQKRVETSDGAGGRTVAHVEFASAWASIEPMRGEEFISADTGAVTTVQKIKVRLRYQPEITTSCRIVRDDGTIMNIREALDIELRHAVLELICDEGGSEA